MEILVEKSDGLEQISQDISEVKRWVASKKEDNDINRKKENDKKDEIFQLKKRNGRHDESAQETSESDRPSNHQNLGRER